MSHASFPVKSKVVKRTKILEDPLNAYVLDLCPSAISTSSWFVPNSKGELAHINAFALVNDIQARVEYGREEKARSVISQSLCQLIPKAASLYGRAGYFATKTVGVAHL